MKILFYINAIHHGGAERVIVNLAEQFANNKDQSILVTSFFDEWEYKVSNNVKRISLFQKEIPGIVRRNIKLVISLRRLIKKEKPDLVISFMAQPNFRSLISCMGLKTKNLISIRNDPTREYSGKINSFLAKMLFKKADGVVFQTYDAQKWFPVSIQKKSLVIFNQVDRVFYDTKYEGERKNIVTTGRLVEQKNHELLIRSFANIADKINDNLIIYGEGELKEKLEALINSLGLKDRVFLPGAVKDVAATIKSAKLFVLSSDYEGMPNALMEAMALGIPCISTDCPCGGPRMLFGDLSSFLLVKVGDMNALGELMLKMVQDKNEQERIGLAMKKQSCNFMPDTVFMQWKQYVYDLIR